MELVDTAADGSGNDALLKHLQAELSPYGKKFLCAFSGGLDSHVLLHAMAKIPSLGLRAIHIHHGLHHDADTWARHCQKICDALKIDLTTIRVNVAFNAGEGTEASARRARYQAIAENIQADEVLLTAHHLQDQSETLLLRLLRGSGSHGLAAMRANTFANGFQQLRPLLSVPKPDLQHYAESENLDWIEDPSNAKTDFDRNYLRHEIMPLLEKRWQQAADNFSRSAALLAEEHECLREQSAIFLAQIQGIDAHSIRLSGLLGYSKAWRAQILRAWTQSLNTPPMPANILQAIEHTVLTAKPDAVAIVQWSGMEISRWRDGLYCKPLQKDMPDEWQRDWDGTSTFTLPDGEHWGFEALHGNPVGIANAIQNNFGGNLLIALRQGGEKILLENREHHSIVKKCLQELGIPPWERTRLPLVFSKSGECLAVGDVLLSARFKAFCENNAVRFSHNV